MRLLQNYSTISAVNLVVKDASAVPELRGIEVTDIETEEVKMSVKSASIRIFKHEKAKLKQFKGRKINLTMDLWLGKFSFAPLASSELDLPLETVWVLVSLFQA